MTIKRIEPGPVQESVWDYPRPPRLDKCHNTVKVVFGEVVIAESGNAKRVLETSHPPTYYIPAEDVRSDLLKPSHGQSFCEWKGMANYFDVVIGERRVVKAAWAYASPTRAFEAIRDHLAFYPHLMDACYVGDEQVQSQGAAFMAVGSRAALSDHSRANQERTAGRLKQ